MKISCCIFDLDGTLLNSDHVISERDKETLKNLSREGVKIVIATGRTDLQIAQFLYELDISDPVIACNGGLISNPVTKEIIHRSLLNPSDVETIVNALLEEGRDFLLYSPEYVYHAPDSRRIQFFLNYNKTARPEFKVPILPLSELPSVNPYSEILKVLIHDDPALIPEVERRFNKDNTLTIVSSGKNLIDIMPANTTKGLAVKMLTEYLNIPISEVVAFGDSPNDESMLRAAGFSVAMGNADQSIKDICDFVTKTNDDYGITFALNHIINEL